MSEVYSERFVFHWGVAGWAHYTPPAGRRAVLRNTTLTADLSGSSLLMSINGVWIWRWTSPGVSSAASLQHRITIYAGESLSFYFGDDKTGLSADGFLFHDNALRDEVPLTPEEIEDQWADYVAALE